VFGGIVSVSEPRDFMGGSMSEPSDKTLPPESTDAGVVREQGAALRRRRAMKIAATLAAILVLAALFFLPLTGNAEDAARRGQCLNNLKRIGVALHNYERANGTLPPAYISDSRGRPIHSWRVLILPYFEGVRGSIELFDAYSFAEPWDGPHNRQLLARMPDCYRCPADGSAEPFTTNYVAVIGDETAWPFDRGLRPAEITDGESNTIAVVETVGLNVPWMQPRDLEFAMIDFAINSESGYGMSSKHSPEHSMADVLFCDGRVQTLFSQLGAESMRAPLTVAGGENPVQP
jgi:hypothetical protein